MYVHGGKDQLLIHAFQQFDEDGNVISPYKLLPSIFNDLSEDEKANFLKSIALYIAPNTGGESFGIIIAEAMAGGAAVVASDIPAFHDLLGGGQYGALFASEDSQSLAKVVIDLLREDEKRKALADAGRAHAQRFDWSLVANQVYEIYEKALASGEKLNVTSESRAWDWLLIRDNG